MIVKWTRVIGEPTYDETGQFIAHAPTPSLDDLVKSALERVRDDPSLMFCIYDVSDNNAPYAVVQSWSETETKHTVQVRTANATSQFETYDKPKR